VKHNIVVSIESDKIQATQLQTDHEHICLNCKHNENCEMRKEMTHVIACVYFEKESGVMEHECEKGSVYWDDGSVSGDTGWYLCDCVDYILYCPWCGEKLKSEVE